MKMLPTTLTLENPVFKAFLGYGGIVLLKTMLMSLVTAYYRHTRQVFINEEDADKFMKDKTKITLNNPSVERSRRAHLNDLENIPPFILLGLMYVTTGPNPFIALLHFRIFTVARIVHSVAYLLKIPQPARAFGFLTGLAVNISLALQLIAQGFF